MLKGEKVLLRPVRRSDISFFLKWFNDPEVIQYLGMYLPMTEMAEEKWVDHIGSSTTDAVFIIEALESGNTRPIGSLGLHRIDPKDRWAMFGIAIGEKEYWNRGYGTEAARLIIHYGFQQLNLHRISSSAFAFNERSLQLHRKLGFQQEGCRRQAVFKNGRYWDMIDFGILREEWS